MRVSARFRTQQVPSAISNLYRINQLSRQFTFFLVEAYYILELSKSYEVYFDACRDPKR